MSFFKSYIHIIKVVFLYQVLFFSTIFTPLHAEIKKHSNIDSELSIVNSDERENTISSEYLLGPGDSIFIEFIGLDIFTNNYQIGREGKIFLPEMMLIAHVKDWLNMVEIVLLDYKFKIDIT